MSESLVDTGPLRVQADGNLGAVEIATFLSLVLLGISLSQGYTFFRRSERDRWTLKLMVSILMILELFHSFTAAHTIYFETITRWDRSEINSYSLSANVVTETLITVIVQSFFSYRICRLSKKLPITIACFGLSVARFIAGLAMSAEMLIDVRRIPTWVVFISRFNWLVTSALALGGATDILIAASMIFYLRRLSSKGNMKSTTQILNRLVRYSLQTGLLTGLTSVAVIISFQAMQNLVWFALYIVLAKIYSNSLLASLNARPRATSTRYPARTRGKGYSTRIDFETNPQPISVQFNVDDPTDTTSGSAGSRLEWPVPQPPSSSTQVHRSDDLNPKETFVLDDLDKEKQATINV